MTYRKIDTKIWSDSAFLELSPMGKLAYSYLLTAPQGNLSGCFECSAACMAKETGMTKEQASEAIAEIVAQELAYVCEQTNEIMIRSWPKHQWSKSPKMVKPLARDISKVVAREFRLALGSKYEEVTGIPYPYDTDKVSIPYGYDIDTVSDEKSSDESQGEIPYRYDIDTVTGTGKVLTLPDDVKDPPNPSIPEEPRSCFKRPGPEIPTLEDVERYAKSHGLTVDCKAFYEVNEARNWTINGEKIKYWRALLNRWDANQIVPKNNVKRDNRPVVIMDNEKCPKCGRSSWYMKGRTYLCPSCGEFELKVEAAS